MLLCIPGILYPIYTAVVYTTVLYQWFQNRSRGRSWQLGGLAMGIYPDNVVF